MKIIIIGTGDGWDDAPRDGETWGVNSLCLLRPVKLSFQMHNIDKMIATKRTKIEEQIKEVNKLGIPVMTLKKHKLLPTAIPFPVDDMPFKYFTSSMSYMTAYAIHKGATEIEMYGIALYLRREYIRQRPCMEFWIGFARAKGIKVTVHKPTTIFSAAPYAGLYGYDWDDICGQRDMLK